MVGEDGVGKSSLILCLISEEFPENAPARCEPVLIPADVTPERVPTHIVDFSTREQSEQELSDELRRADAICVVYSVDNPESIEKVTSYWMPTIQRVLGVDHGRPVILVGNKCDTNESSMMEQVLPIMNQYSEIETCVECSAKRLKNITELFYYAQKAVLHPTGPLYIPEEKELTQSCKKALVRIFKICDQDNDGLLNDYELNNFQVRCFGVPLNQQSLQDVKSVVRRSINDGILDNALTLKGFLFLHTLFIQRGRHETTWLVLRKFGYDNSLQLSKDYLYPPLRVPRGCSTELSCDGTAFLTALFEKYDEDKDGCLSPAELQNLFSVCPIQPWGPEVHNMVTTNDQGWITFQGYICHWVLTTMLDLPRTLEYLAYLGYNTIGDRNQVSAITITRDKRIDYQKKDTARTVFQCHVIGAKDVGKTALLQGFLGRNLKQQAALNKRQLSSYAINTVNIYGAEKYLLLHEIDVLTPEEALTAYELSADVVCLMYDVSNPHSFEYCAEIYKKYFKRTRIPCLVVAAKADRREALQQYDVQPIDFCRQYHLPAPMKFTGSDIGTANEIYAQLAILANYPHLKRVYSMVHDSSMWAKVTVAAAAVALISFLVFKNVA